MNLNLNDLLHCGAMIRLPWLKNALLLLSNRSYAVSPTPNIRKCFLCEHQFLFQTIKCIRAVDLPGPAQPRGENGWSEPWSPAGRSSDSLTWNSTHQVSCTTSGLLRETSEVPAPTPKSTLWCTARKAWRTVARWWQDNVDNLYLSLKKAMAASFSRLF